MENEEGINLSLLRDQLPPFVPRNWIRWKELIPISPRTIANLDSKKPSQGPKGRFLMGNVICYPRDELIAWLQRRSKRV